MKLRVGTFGSCVVQYGLVAGLGPVWDVERGRLILVKNNQHSLAKQATVPSLTRVLS